VQAIGHLVAALKIEERCGGDLVIVASADGSGFDYHKRKSQHRQVRDVSGTSSNG